MTRFVRSRLLPTLLVAFVATTAFGTYTEIPPPPGYTLAHASDVSRDGTVVVGTVFNSNTTRAFIWTAATGMQLLQPADPQGRSDAATVSDNKIVFGQSLDNSTGWHACYWDSAGKVHVIPGLAGGVIHDCSGDGTVAVGGARDSNGDFDAIVWDATHGIRYIPNGQFAEAVSEDGKTVAANTKLGSGGLLWTEAGGAKVAVQSRYLRGISSDGTLLVGGGALRMRYPGAISQVALQTLDPSLKVSDSGDFVLFSFQVWTPGTGVVSTNDYLRALGAPVGSWQSATLASCSRDGRTVVGYSSSSSGESGFVVTSAPIPHVNLQELSALEIEPAPRVGGNPVHLSATLTAKSPAGGSWVTQAVEDPTISLQMYPNLGNWKGVMIPGGAFTGITYANTHGSLGGSFIYFSLGPLFYEARLTLLPADLYIPTISATSVKGGGSLSIECRLNGEAPPGDAWITVGNSNRNVCSVPPLVKILSQERAVRFTINTLKVTQNTPVTLSFTYRSKRRTVQFTVTP